MKIFTKLKLVRKIITVASMLLCGILIVGTVICAENADVINNSLGIRPFETIDNTDPNQDTEYYKSDYTKIGDLIKAGKYKTTEVMGEGSVLLKNQNNALPLGKGNKVSLFGVTAYDPVYGGTGSGTISTAKATNYVDSLEEAGLVLNPELKTSYTSEGWKQYKRSSTGSFGKTVQRINEAPWSAVEPIVASNLSEYGDAAIFIVGRIGGEGNDVARKLTDGIDNNDGLGPDYLGLNENELGVLEGLKAKKAEGKIKKIIMLVNYASMIEGDFAKDDKIDAVMWVGALGEGGAAIGRLLVGDTSPSGRLPDTMWMDNAKNPVNVNFGSWFFPNAEDFGVSTLVSEGNFPEASLSKYVVYQEGMYLGYKYTETRYEDTVLKTPKVGSFKYDEVVAYPFGHGLSYADIEYGDVNVTKKGAREYEVSVTVTNKATSKYPAKYSVPVYISKPYGDYARENNIQVPSVELIDFEKTKLLNPGESDTLKITLDEKFFASYDAYGAQGYVLQKGDYYVAVGGSAHEAVNNVLAAKKANGATIDETKMVGGKGDASKVKKFTLGFDKDKYAFSDSVSSLDGKNKLRVTNLFDFVDINRYSGKGGNHVDYYSRDNWEAVSLDMTNGHVKLTMTEQMVKEIYEQVPELVGKYNGMGVVPEKYRQPIGKDDIKYPEYGKDAGLMLIDMMYDSKGESISFFDPVWDTFMDQLTWEDTVKLVSSGGHLTEAVERIAKPQTGDENGPNGLGGWRFRNGYYTGSLGLAYRNAKKNGGVDEKGNIIKDKVDQDGYSRPTGFPANGILAATFNKELAYEAGRIIGNDGIWAGYSGIYGTGLNIHRSPYSGRTCEYFSEDGMLSGLMGAEESRGMESCGLHVYNKHCVLNDQENNRHGIATWVTEQALREIYLRAFELPITKGGAYNTMASFNRLGTYSGAACKELGTDFLRGECGMKGIIVTDAYQDLDGNLGYDPYFEQAYGTLVGGSDIPDGAAPKNEKHFDKFETGYGEMAWAMRLSAKRVCYQTLWSNAMNGFSSDTRIVIITPWWQKLLISLDVIIGVIFGAAAIWTVLAAIAEEKERIKG